MDKAIIEKIYTTLMAAAVTFVAGFIIKKIWTVVTGEEPPNPEDLDVPTKQAVTWFLASGVGVGVAQLLVSRTIKARVKTMGKKLPAA
ncbi:MAG: DUF4235 domain-containing protein [Propionibacteriaceae bacterium]|jgi:hypothetical protein|nr:DUF4235 domain-containing protein [Propionibacteriaceae bacterium]